MPVGGIVLLDLINALATNRTKANMNPPTAVPYITETGAYPSLPQHRAHLSIAAFLAFGCARSPVGRNKAEGWFDLHFLGQRLAFLENYLCDFSLWDSVGPSRRGIPPRFEHKEASLKPREGNRGSL